MRIVKLVIGLIAGTSALMIGVIALAQQTMPNRCVTFTYAYFGRSFVMDTQTGQALPVRTRPPLDPGNLDSYTSPDVRYSIQQTEGLPSTLIWEQTYPYRTQRLLSGDLSVSWVAWAPDSSQAIYVVQNADSLSAYATWNRLDTRTGRVDTTIARDSDIPYFEEPAENGKWSADGHHFAAVIWTEDDTQPVRLYLMERDAKTYTTVDLPDLASGPITSWSPDGRILAIFGNDTQNVDQGRVLFYSVATGELISRLSGTDSNPRIIQGDLIWSPDSRAFYTLGTGIEGEDAGWDVYGIDGSAHFKVGDCSSAAGWRYTDSRLLMVETVPGDLEVKRLVAFDPVTNTRQMLVDRVLEAIGSEVWMVVTSTQPDGSIAADSINLRQGTHQRLIGGITSTRGLNWARPFDEVAFLWYRGTEYHVSLITVPGNVRSDFVELDPNGFLVSLEQVPYALYSVSGQVNPSTRVLQQHTIYLLNLETGTYSLLMQSAYKFLNAVQESSKDNILLVLQSADGEIVRRVFTVAGQPVPIGNSSNTEFVSASPDGKHAVRWSVSPGTTVEPLILEIHSESGVRRIALPGSTVRPTLMIGWSPDSRYFALAYSVTRIEAIQIEVYSTDGERIRTLSIRNETGLNQFEWAPCF